MHISQSRLQHCNCCFKRVRTLFNNCDCDITVNQTVPEKLLILMQAVVNIAMANTELGLKYLVLYVFECALLIHVGTALQMYSGCLDFTHYFLFEITQCKYILRLFTNRYSCISILLRHLPCYIYTLCVHTLQA